MRGISDDSLDKLRSGGLIKECPVNPKAIEKLLERANIDLDTAQRNLNEDPECSYIFIYNAILRSGLALMFHRGLRPDIKDKHQTVVRFVAAALDIKMNPLITDYNIMRRKRNRFIYEPDVPCSKSEAEFSLDVARRLVEHIKEILGR